MFFSDNAAQFRDIVLRELDFHAEKQTYFTHYQNSDGSSFRFYQKENLYDFGIADYTIGHNFAIRFDNSEPLLRFGIVYDGTTRFQLDHQAASVFLPSASLVYEKELHGIQKWLKGQHFHGAEITIYPDFVRKLEAAYPDFRLSDYFIPNHTYYHLPSHILQVLHRMLYLDRTGRLNPLHLEAAILECMAAIFESGEPDGQNAFSRQVDYGTIEVGKDRRQIALTANDFHCIQTAKDILTEQFRNPPTIDSLSRQLLITPQKLKAGFSHYYHMTIGEYVSSLRMSLAASLLCTTEQSVAEIARETGYSYTSNFIRKFQDTYSCTPLKYRKREKRK